MTLVLAAALLAPLVGAEPVTWEEAWHERVIEAGGLNLTLLTEFREFRGVGEVAPEQDGRGRRGAGSVGPDHPQGGESWRSLIAAHFPGREVDRAVCVVGWESGGNPAAENPRSSAVGLFQIMFSVWGPEFGIGYDELMDPAVNTWVAREVWDRQGWRAWAAVTRGVC